MAPYRSTSGEADGSIMAAIMTLHMAKTASQLASDHAGVMGIISWASGLDMLVAPHSRSSHPASAAVHMTAVVQGNARRESPSGVFKSLAFRRRGSERWLSLPAKWVDAAVATGIPTAHLGTGKAGTIAPRELGLANLDQAKDRRIHDRC